MCDAGRQVQYIPIGQVFVFTAVERMQQGKILTGINIVLDLVESVSPIAYADTLAKKTS
jgi:hypothetical protein